MSGAGQGGRGKTNVGKSVSRTTRAGLVMPVGRIAGKLKKGRYSSRVGSGASVYAAAVMEYVAAEILELAGNVTKDNKRTRITPRFLQTAIQNDADLKKLVKGAIISGGGVMPHIEPALMPKNALLPTKRTKAKKSKPSG